MASTYLLLGEIAEETRTPISTVRHWVAIGKLPSVRPGRRRLVKRADLDAFMAASAVVETEAAQAEPSELERRRAQDACRRLGVRP